MMLQIEDLNDFIQHLKDEFSNLRASDIIPDVDDEFFSANSCSPYTHVVSKLTTHEQNSWKVAPSPYSNG